MRGSSRPPPPPGEAAGRRAGLCCSCRRRASGGDRSASLPGSPLPAGETLRTADGGRGGGRALSPRGPRARTRAEEAAAAAPGQGQRRAAGAKHKTRPRSRWKARGDGQPAGAAPDRAPPLIPAGGREDAAPRRRCGGGRSGTCRPPARLQVADTRDTAPSTLSCVHARVASSRPSSP